ncbi:SDR family NAD(P)-dependent oxidoreductase [Seonamhaeicola aphaedonensis]|uniref:3-oxoacyl-[acyl-carrier protein] reductase n=1 Tax=Seonamhaeicola aphaedonensis TaxID=1461338 RepID=A0A3D9HES7_9FLAO|nr:SDR family oxidoreductase [Seonamhaeicola aphaedonensis]RED47486.1 3-oxoacyl-[acyl-carrier protein] reductase [Seonamhaeicola aphaedonensis]
MSRLENKVAIVTGAADGIGLAISKAFAKEGANVVMCDIDGLKSENEAQTIEAKGGSVVSHQCDVGNTEAIEQLVKATIDKFQKIDVLVNNAAVAIPGDVRDMPESDWDMLMNINLKGVFRGIKAVLPYMVKAKSGSIITLSSTQAHRSWDNWTAYAAAKGGILSMHNQLAGQFGSENVRFNTISPGAILTSMNQKRVEIEGEGFLKGSINQAAMLRLGLPEEVAMTAVFLASDEAQFITGQDIIIDGGLTTLPRYFEN